MTEKDVKRLIAYMIGVWPGYARWGEYQNSRVYAVWRDGLTRNGVTYEDCIAGVQWLYEGARREQQWPPSLGEVLAAAVPERDARQNRLRQARIEEERRADHLDRIERAKEMLKRDDLPPGQRKAIEAFLEEHDV